MGNASHVRYHQLTELREKQHLLFHELSTDEINFDTFRTEMMKHYDQMDSSSWCHYRTLLKNGHITDKKSALSSKYEFNLEAISLDPFPIGYFTNKL